MKKVSISAPMPMHSYQTGTSLSISGLLDRYYTSVYNDNSILYRFMQRYMSKRISDRVANKRCEVLDKNIKKYCEFEGLVFVGGGYIPIIKNHTVDVIRHMNRRFGKLVAKDLIRQKTDAVIAYDTYAKDLFSYLNEKNADVIKILDMSSASSKTIADIIQEECKKDYPLLDTMVYKKKVYSEEAVADNIQEIQLADYLLAGCQFVVNSLLDSGVSREKIKLVPYGIDIETFRYVQKQERNNGTLTFLFVGRVEAAKGIWYLLEAFRNPKITERNVKLRVIGDIRTSLDHLEKYRKNVTFEGMKLPGEMPQIYLDSDIYILSSLWEGFSLSLLEAMSVGMPAIASRPSSGPDVISDYENGIMIDPANTESIVKAVIWFDEHRNQIPQMSAAARKRIEEKYTLEKYYERLDNAVKEILEDIAQ